MWYNIHLPKISRKYSSPKLFPTELIAEQEKLDLISDDREFRLRIGTFTPGIVTSFLKHCKYLFCIQYLDIVFSIRILYSVFGYCIQYPDIVFSILHKFSLPSFIGWYLRSDFKIYFSITLPSHTLT